MRILISIDGSPNSTRALEWALENLGLTQKDKVYLLSVGTFNNTFPTFVEFAMDVLDPEGVNDLDYPSVEAMERARKITRQAEDLLLQSRIVPDYETVCLVGEDCRDLIVEYASELKPDLLVMGSRGLGFLKKMVLGSTSDYCMHNANCPVAVIK